MAKSTCSTCQHETMAKHPQIESKEESDKDNEKFRDSTDFIKTEPMITKYFNHLNDINDKSALARSWRAPNSVL